MRYNYEFKRKCVDISRGKEELKITEEETSPYDY